MALWFDPAAEVSIAPAAEAAYARNPLPQLPPSQFNVQGGVIYAGTPGYDDQTWNPEALWMPRFSFGYKLGEKNVIKGGYGVYYDTLNARDFAPNQEGYDVTTANPVSTDFGQTWLLGDPRRGILPLADPFPDTSQREPVSNPRRLLARRGHHPRSRRRRIHGREPQSASLARAAVACGLAAGSWQPHRARYRLCRFVCRPAGDRHPRGLSPRAVLEQCQRPRHQRERFSHRQRAEPVQHRELRVNADERPGALRAAGGERVLHIDHDPAAPAPAAVPAHEQLEQWPATERSAAGTRSSPTRSSSS